MTEISPASHPTDVGYCYSEGSEESRFIPLVEMTSPSGVYGVGGGAAAINPHPSYVSCCHSERSEEFQLSFRTE